MLQDVLKILKPSLIVQGGAKGADELARLYAEHYLVNYKTFEADWCLHGKAAGPIRNKEMLLAHSDAVVVAFPGGKGTENCVKTAVELNMIVLRVEK